MKTKLLASIAIVLAACSTTQQTQTLQTAADIANTAGTAYAAYSAAQAGTLTPAQTSAALQAASNDLSGIALLAQAYVGSGQTPATAKIQQGAANLSAAAKIVNQLPNVPITQTTANQLFQAASLVTATSPGTTQASLPVNWISREPLPHFCHAYRVKIDPSALKRLTFAANPQIITIRP